MFGITLRDFVWLAVFVVTLIGWSYDHALAARRVRTSRAAQTDLATVIQRQTELADSMRQRLDEYENQHVLMRRLLRVTQQRRD
jgi:hypothetical protein